MLYGDGAVLPSLENEKLSSALPVNAQASAATVSVYRRLLLEFGNGKIALGANDRTARLDGFETTYDNSAILSAAGKKPVYQSYEFIPKSLNFSAYTNMQNRLRSHAAEGGICALHTHMPDFRNKNRSSWARDKVDFSAVTDIQIGGSANAAYFAYLADLVQFSKELVDENGVRIPLILRLFHESNGWSDEPDNPVVAATYLGSGVVQITCQNALQPYFDTSSKVWHSGFGSSVLNGFFEVESIISSDSYTIVSGNPGAIGALGISYLAVGFWWSGHDRAESLKTVWRETVGYLTGPQGSDSFLFNWCVYPHDGSIFTSSNPASFPYEAFYPGDAYVDIIGPDWYGQSNGGFGIDKAGWRSSMNHIFRFSAQTRKPIIFSEFGYRNGAAQAGLWKELTFDVLFRHHPYVAVVAVWNEDTFPKPSDSNYDNFKLALTDDRIKGL